MKPHDGFRRGDVVQVTDESHDFFPSLMIVTDIGEVSCDCCWFDLPMNEPSRPARPVWTRLFDDQIQRIVDGSAYYVPPAIRS